MTVAQLRGLTIQVPSPIPVVFVLGGKELEFNLCEFHKDKMVLILKEKPSETVVLPGH